MGKSLDIGHTVWFLVHSLTGYEKHTVIKQLALTSEGSHSQVLFNLLDRMEVYDRKLLLETYLKNSPDSNPSRSLANLRDFIYRNLPCLYLEPHGELSRTIQAISIAFHKQDYETGLKLCKQGKKAAWESEAFAKLLEVLGLEREIILADRTFEEKSSIRESNSAEMKKVLELQDNYIQYVFLEDEFYKKYKATYFHAGGKEDSLLRQLEKHELMKSPGKAQSVRAQSKYYKLKAAIAWAKQEEAEAKENNAHFLRLFEVNSWLKNDYGQDYLQEVRLSALLDVNAGRIAEARKSLEIIDAQNGQSRAGKAIVKGNSLLVKLAICLKQEDAKIYVEAVQEFDVWADEICLFFEPSYTQSLLYIAIVLAWQNKSHSRAYKWIDILLSFQDSGKKQDIQLAARIYHLIFLFDEKSYRSLSSLSQTYLRYAKQIKWPHPLEKTLIGFFRNIEPETTMQELQQKIYVFQQKLKKEVPATDWKRFERNTGILRWLNDTVGFSG